MPPYKILFSSYESGISIHSSSMISPLAQSLEKCRVFFSSLLCKQVRIETIRGKDLILIPIIDFVAIILLPTLLSYLNLP